MRAKRSAALGFAIVLSASLAACGTSAPSHFYTLSPNPAAPSQSAMAEMPSVAISAVTIPGTLDRPEMVRFVGSDQITIAEQARWGEPLAHGIGRTVAEDLRDRLGLAAVAAYPQEAIAGARYRITIDFSHLDAGADGSVLLDAIWSIHDTTPLASSSAPGTTGVNTVKADRIKRGHTRLTQDSRGSSFDALVQTESAALGRLADELAQALQVFQTTP